MSIDFGLDVSLSASLINSPGPLVEIVKAEIAQLVKLMQHLNYSGLGEYVNILIGLVFRIS
jgi:hypothetical protein